MLPILTPRLQLRAMRLADGETVAAYRSDPAVAHFQDWPMPYDSAGLLERLAAAEGLGPDLTAGTNLVIEVDGQLVGDVYVRLDGGVAEIGYTLRPEHRGRGYATEAAAALVDHLIEDHGVHRITAGLDPENVASMRILEAIGMRKEAVAREAYLVRGKWVDDLRYSMLAAERSEWVQRTRTVPGTVELVEITPADAYLWGRLATHHSQERLVSPMALSFRDALFPEVVDGAPVVPWLRGVLADGERAAFVMVAATTEVHTEPFLWRLLVDRMHQRRGIGKLALAALVRQLSAEGHRTLLTSWNEGIGSPRPFYEALGFVPTGRDVDGETEARLSW